MNLKGIKDKSYDEIFEFIIDSYIREFGERKFNSILNRVMTSNKISGMISTLKFNALPPGSKDFLYCLNSIPYFMFSSGQSQALAAILGLQRWNEEVNSHQYLLNEEGLKLRAINILEESKITFI